MLHMSMNVFVAPHTRGPARTIIRRLYFDDSELKRWFAVRAHPAPRQFRSLWLASLHLALAWPRSSRGGNGKWLDHRFVDEGRDTRISEGRMNRTRMRWSVVFNGNAPIRHRTQRRFGFSCYDHIFHHNNGVGSRNV